MTTAHQPGTYTAKLSTASAADVVPIEGQLWIEPWHDPVIDSLGHDPRSRYVETYWLGVLGPSTTWLLRRFADALDQQPTGFALNLSATAGELGLGRKGGKHSPFMRSLDRCCQFGLAQRTGRTMRVRRVIPPLTQGQTNRLPEHLRIEHRRYQQGQLQPVDDNGQRAEAKAQRVALTLLELGESPEQTERQLVAWDIARPVAARALQWASQQRGAAGSAA